MTTPDDQPRRQTLATAPGTSRPLVGLFGRSIVRAGPLLPLGLLHGVGALAGWLAGALPTRTRARALVNLTLAFPERSLAERRRLARMSLAHIGASVMEFPALYGWRGERVLGLIREVRGEELFERALGQGRGVILAMPHLGSWEMVGLYVSSRHPMTALYRPNRVSEMDPVIRGGRGRFGASLVPAGVGAVRSLRRALQRGETTVILPDTDPRKGQAVFAPLFGEPAHTSTLVSRLGRGSGAPVLMCVAERIGFGRGYRMHFRETDPAVTDGDPLTAATALNREVEALLREFPEQYLWRYRRYRTRPPGSPSLYDRKG